MGTLMVYIDWLSTAQSCLDGKQPPDEMGKCELNKPVELPLTGPTLKELYGFYQGRFATIKHSKLAIRRKELYIKFTQHTYYAYDAVNRGPSQAGTVLNLREAVVHLLKALRLVEKTKDFDDANPVQRTEWPLRGPPGAKETPEESWLCFKLASIQPCLRLSVRVLRLIFPECSDIWHECEESLTMAEWVLQFVLDSKRSQERSLPLYAPRRSDIVGPAPSRELDGAP
ncbi:hypothetical protein F5X96DRAFT_84666 [Biscogniauxia mediterranea]|nr:hypothetical protein F5X96DRAFT_84666 [Biscogniauxia mediterranea]